MLVREWLACSELRPWYYQEYHVGRIPFTLHYHPEFELTLTHQAEGWRYVAGESRRFSGLDLTLVAPNQAHSWHSPPREDGQEQHLQIVFFRGSWLRELAEHGLPELRSVCNWLDRIAGGVLFSPEVVQQVLPFFDALKQRRGVGRPGMVFELLDVLSRADDSVALGGELFQEVPDRRLQLALDYLQANHLRPISVADVARHCYCSEAHLKRILAQQLGSSFSELLLRLRVRHASHLLVTTQQSMDSIAAQSGFPSSSNFFRLFARCNGMTPGQFRRQGPGD